ncbi:MAG TPA: hypothetical protein VK849_05355 [Longimicrobiales bacterium]|nr:hypothetical protein [Longimicrobiales bacterium]
MNRKALLLLAMLPGAACSTSTDPQPRADALLAGGEVELTLSVGEEVQVPGTVLRVGFTRIEEDSRCPIDVICVWQGNAAVELAFTLGTGPTVPHVVNTTLEPHAATTGGYTVTLLEVQPAPTSQGPIDEERYRVKVRVEA